MFKKSFFLFFFLVCVCASQTSWIKNYGGSEADYGRFVQETSDGGFVVAGLTYSTNPPSALLIRTDSAGDTLWVKKFKHDFMNDIISAKKTNDGGFVILSHLYFSDDDQRVYMIRTDPNVDTIWTKVYGYGRTFGNCVQQISDGGFIITGVTSSSTIGDVLLIRTDSKGDTLWVKNYNGLGHDVGNSVVQTSDGGFVVAGSTSLNGAVGCKVLLIRTDSKGDTLWTKMYGGDVEAGANSMQLLSDNGFILVGTKGMPYNNDAYLIRTDSAGDTLWTKTYGGTALEWGTSVQQTSDGGFILTGATTSFSPPWGKNVYLIQTDADGDTLWTKTFGDSCDDVGESVIQTNDGGFVVAGTIGVNPSNSDIYLIKTNPDGSVKTKNYFTGKTEGYRFKVRRNAISYFLPIKGLVNISVYNSKGILIQEVVDKQCVGRHSVTWDSFISNGVYYIRFLSANNSITKKFVVAD